MKKVYVIFCFTVKEWYIGDKTGIYQLNRFYFTDEAEMALYLDTKEEAEELIKIFLQFQPTWVFSTEELYITDKQE